MIPSYASHRTKPNSSDFTVSSLAGTAANVKRNFYIQFQNRAGRSLLSEPKSITSTGVLVTISSNLIQTNEEVFWVLVSTETTDNPQDAIILASWQVRENNQVTQRSLPATISLLTEEDLLGDRKVISASQLPSTPLPNGAMALALDTGVYYRYDPESYYDSGGNLRSYGAYAGGVNSWIQTDLSFYAYQPSTTELGGSDLRIDTVANPLKIPPKIGEANSVSQRYWFNNGLENDGGSPIVNGRYTLDISVNGVSGYTSVFANKFQYYLRGYLNRETLELNTEIETVDEVKTWNPTKDFIVLPEELPRNFAAVYDFVLVGNNDDFIGVLPSNTPEIQVDFIEVGGTSSKLTELSNLIGDLVFSDRDRLLIVPGPIRLEGIATIKIPNASQGYLIDNTSTQLINDLSANTAGQIAAISGSLNGLVTIRDSIDPLESSERVRAVISTESGISRLLPTKSDPIVVNSTGIDVTIRNPVNSNGNGIIRENYSDSFIAGNERGEFTPTAGFVFLDIDGSIYQSQELDVGAIEEQTFNFSNLSEFALISNLPSSLDEDFSLFEPNGKVEVTTTSTGTISGTVKAYFGYYYDETNVVATKIRHDLPECIPIASNSIAKIISELRGLIDHLSDRNNPHEVKPEQIGAVTTLRFNSAIDLINGAIASIPRTNVFQVDTIGDRDNIPNPSESYIVKVKDDGFGKERDYIYDGYDWVALAGALQTSEEIRDSLSSLSAPDKLKGSAIAGLADIINDPVDGYVLTYSAAENALVWRSPPAGSSEPVMTETLIFEVDFSADGRISEYTDSNGEVIFSDVKLITTASTPDNTASGGETVITTPNTGVVSDLGESDVIMRIDYKADSDSISAIILRYESEGNGIILALTQGAIALKEIVNDVDTTFAAAAFDFVIGTQYAVEVKVLANSYTVTIDSIVQIENIVNPQFVNATKFGLATILLDPVGNIYQPTAQAVLLAENLPSQTQAQLQNYYDLQSGVDAPDDIVPQAVTDLSNSYLTSSNYHVYLGHNIWFYKQRSAGNWTVFSNNGKSDFGAPIEALFTFK